RPVARRARGLRAGRERPHHRGREPASAARDVHPPWLSAQALDPDRLADREGRHDPDPELHRHAAGHGAAEQDSGPRPDVGVVPRPAAEPAVALRPRPLSAQVCSRAGPNDARRERRGGERDRRPLRPSRCSAGGPHPGQYFWNGRWKKYGTVAYDIPVLGGSSDHLSVKLSVHGPVIGERGLTTSVWWAGNMPSQDLGVLLRIGQASDFAGFRAALRDWHSPTHNFVYSDDKGNIGLISAGYYPQVAQGTPWLPMPGTGENDVTGTIPYDQIPQVYNPPSGVVWSANQRQVANDYPYYIGTSSNFF